MIVICFVCMFLLLFDALVAFGCFWMLWLLVDDLLHAFCMVFCMFVGCFGCFWMLWMFFLRKVL